MKSNFRFNFQFDVNFAVTGLELVTNSVSRTKNGNGPVAIDDSSFTHGTPLGNLALTETIKIQFKIRLNDQILVSSSIPIEIGCDFSFKKQSTFLFERYYFYVVALKVFQIDE